MTQNLVAQTKNAVDFLEKLFFEISYLVKEVEGLLQQEEECFVIGRPSGYAVQSRTSSGLEPVNVEKWLPKTFSVFFCPKPLVKIQKGQTITPFHESTRLILLHIEVHGKNVAAPRLMAGCLWNIRGKKKYFTKFERAFWEFAYNSQKIFAKMSSLNYDSGNCSFEGRGFEVPLFSINSSDDLMEKVVKPVLKLYREQ